VTHVLFNPLLSSSSTPPIFSLFFFLFFFFLISSRLLHWVFNSVTANFSFVFFLQSRYNLDEKNRKNLVFLILQFFDEEGYEKSLHLYGCYNCYLILIFSMVWLWLICFVVKIGAGF
ncbi:unnamed protein product, partial [Arabidopsis halleri]